MANYYTSQSIANYSDDAPADDGTQSEANRVKYATVKTELSDPVKVLAEAIDTELGNLEGRLFANGSTAQSTNYTTQASDLGKVVLASNTITITLLAAATAGDGHLLAVKNVGTGTVTVDGNASETIDGATTVELQPEEIIILRCDASNWDILANSRIPSIQDFTSSNTYTPTPGTKAIHVQVQAVGGVGGGTGATGAGETNVNGGGGGGGYCEKLITTVAATATITIGGAAVASSFADGTETLTAQPGTAPSTAVAGTVVNSPGAAGGTATGGDINIPGGPGHAASAQNSGGNVIGHSGQGGDSWFGKGGIAKVPPASGNVTNGAVGQVYGGGGSGSIAHASANAGTGGAGGAAIIRIKEFH